MAILGNSTTPGLGSFYDDSGNSQFFSQYVVPAGGAIISALDVYFAGDGASITAEFCIWNGNTLAWNSTGQSIPSGTRTIGGQAWHSIAVPNVFIPGGANLNIGFWTAGYAVWTYESSNVTYAQHSMVAPGTIGAPGTDGAGGLGSYVTYTPGGVSVSPAGTVQAPVAIYMSPAGTVKKVIAIYVNKSGVVTQIW